MSLRQSRFDIRQAGKRILFLLALVALANAGFYLLWVRPEMRDYEGLRRAHGPGFDALKERKEEVAHREAFLAGLKKAEADLARLREDVLSTREQRLVEVQAEVERLAEEFHIDLTSVGYDQQILRDEQLDRMVMNVPLEGGYANLRKFLQAVEDSDKFLVVERVALAKGKRGGKMLSLSISLATYFTPPAELIERLQRRGRRS